MTTPMVLPNKTDVLVVGAGPVGLATALSLVARGRNVTIVDKQEQGANTSRASVVYPRTLEVLDAYGVAERLIAQGMRARRFTIRDRDRILITVPFDRLPTAYRFTLLVSQAVTESVLLQRLQDFGTAVLRPYTVTNVTQDSSAVTAFFETGERVDAKYLVGADGLHSTVRERAHIGYPRGGSYHSYTLADVHFASDSDGIPKDEVAVYFAPEGQLVCVPFPDGSFKLVANVGEAPEQPDVQFMQRLVDSRGPQAQRARIQDIVWGSRFRIHHGVADRFRAGRVALAGDAAHDNSPLGGQGMNTGICDATVLAAALDRAIQHDAPDQLEAYASARRPVAKQVVMLTDWLTQLALMDRQLRGLRNLAIGALSPFVSRRFAWQLSGLAYR